MTEWVQQVHQYHIGGMSYGKIAKLMGMSKNKVLSAHRAMRFGMSNSKLYAKKESEPESMLTQITLPKVYGIGNDKYNYREFKYDTEA